MHQPDNSVAHRTVDGEILVEENFLPLVPSRSPSPRAPRRPTRSSRSAWRRSRSSRTSRRARRSSPRERRARPRKSGHVMGWGRVGGGKAWHSHVCTVARTITEVPKRLITMHPPRAARPAGQPQRCEFTASDLPAPGAAPCRRSPPPAAPPMRLLDALPIELRRSIVLAIISDIRVDALRRANPGKRHGRGGAQCGPCTALRRRARRGRSWLARAPCGSPSASSAGRSRRGCSRPLPSSSRTGSSARRSSRSSSFRRRQPFGMKDLWWTVEVSCYDVSVRGGEEMRHLVARTAHFEALPDDGWLTFVLDEPITLISLADVKLGNEPPYHRCVDELLVTSPLVRVSPDRSEDGRAAERHAAREL